MTASGHPPVYERALSEAEKFVFVHGTIPAPRCKCDRPVTETDEEGTPWCIVCGRMRLA